MAFIEQLLYGHNARDESVGRQELAHSAGMGADASAEVRALCDAWGHAPDLGLQTSVLISHPLQSTMPSMRGRLYAVIHGTAGENTLFHAYVLNDATFSGYGRNPFAVANAVEFETEWNGQQGMDRVEVNPEIQGTLVDPPANAGDVGLVVEAVLQFVTKNKLELPIEQAISGSDRALALVIACLPEKDRKTLRFASFTCTRAHTYNITSVEAEGATFAGWQRLMMSQIDGRVTEQQQEYKDLIAGYLAKGDLVGIARVSNRHNFVAPTKTQPLVSTHQGTQPVPASTPLSVAPVSKPSPGAQPPIRKNPAVAMATAGPGTASRFVAHDGHGLDPAASETRIQRSSRRRSRVAARLNKGSRGSGGRFLRTAAVLLVLFVAGWVGTMWLEGRTLAESLEWAGLPGMDGRTQKVEYAGTLLEVVDVGRVYSRALKDAGGKGFGLNAAGDKGRQMALGRLRSNAVEPLFQQVDLFTKLTADGIQQSDRPDREVERLNSLAKQGVVLDKEMARLELAWYSLTTGANWKDLGKMSDKAVFARRDSLVDVEKGVLEDVRLGIGTDKTWRELGTARRRMIGMAEVVRLFQATHWSEKWGQEMAAAAEKVSPSAGQTTRAYRNSAFALVRLKRAERAAENRNLPFAGHYDSDQWPSVAVRSILPLLRKEAGRFSDQNAPDLLAETLALYAQLEAPEKVIARIQKSPKQWQDLQQNGAVRFDPELYGNFLERLRFEAAGRSLVSLHDPAGIPEHLYQGGMRWAVADFADSLVVLTDAKQWQAMAAVVDDPFLGRWAHHLAHNLQARLAHLQQEFDVVWADCRAQSTALQGKAKAGYDWSDDWQALRTSANKAFDLYASTLGEDPDQLGRFTYLSELVAALDEARPLRLTRVTVRLDQDVLSAPTTVQLELRTPVRGGIWTSEPFTVGPSAPAGTGWVGTMFVDWSADLSPRHQMTGRVVTAADQKPLLDVIYPSLAEGGGPALLVRPKAGSGGALSFKVELEEYWSGLNVPELGLVF